ncbi:hypothetical protein RQP54_02175 [Curvibacter sp. APW13]|uniref:hypothetical protein n=1 Tax=Curvibacter sp. APW13 TaxID=3077236 RepID=UPI0028DEA9C9|nr:hypothetical protein [Curvibacter sp. APW13]MDT8989665.1 hypothetical protein [Curvibacter sp. APW13]
MNTQPTETPATGPESDQAEQAFRRLFAEQLNTALDRHRHIPQGHGRVQAVASLFGITRITAGKWLSGEGLPELWRLPQIAQLLNVDANELVGSTTNPMLIDDRYIALQMHGQDTPDELMPLFLQPGTLQHTSIVPGCLIMQVNATDMPAFAAVGDLVVYNPGIKWFGTGADVYVLRVQGRYVLRRAVRTLRGEIVLSTDPGQMQESFSPTDFTSDTDPASPLIHVVGRVVARILTRGSSAA